jgi:hypothetical protein
MPAFFVVVAAIAVGFRGFPGQIEGSDRQTLAVRLAQAWHRPSVLDWPAYYPVLQRSTAPGIDLPASIVDDLTRVIPPLQVLIADPAHSFALPVMLNQHIVNPGHVISTSLHYFDSYARLDDHGTRRHPIFNESGTLTAEERRFLDEYHVDYILANPHYYDVVRNKLDGDSSAFERVYERDRFVLYRCRRAS